MILSDGEIAVICAETALVTPCDIYYARAIEAKVLEKLSDKLRDAERYEWLRKVAPNMFWDNHDKKIGFVKFDTKAHLWEPEVFDQAIDAAIKESK